MWNARKIVLSLSLAILFSLVAPAVHADDSLSAQRDLPVGGEEVVGSWYGTTSLGTVVLFTFGSDNTFTSTFHLPGVGAGTGHGAWRRTGLTTFATTDVGLTLDADNELALIVTVVGQGTVNGNEAQIDVHAYLSLPDGTPAGEIDGEVLARRIAIKPLP